MQPKPSLCIVHTSDIIYLCYVLFVLLFVSGFFLFLFCLHFAQQHAVEETCAAVLL